MFNLPSIVYLHVLSFLLCFLSSKWLFVWVFFLVCPTGIDSPEDLCTLYSNRAACYLKAGNSQDCIQDCTKWVTLIQLYLLNFCRYIQAYSIIKKTQRVEFKPNLKQLVFTTVCLLLPFYVRQVKIILYLMHNWCFPVHMEATDLILGSRLISSIYTPQSPGAAAVLTQAPAAPCHGL